MEKKIEKYHENKLLGNSLDALLLLAGKDNWSFPEDRILKNLRQTN